MAISGFYKSGEHGDLGAYVKAYVRLPRLGVQELLDFLVDSGSDRTILHPDANLILRNPRHRLRSGMRGIATGIGGTRTYYSEPAVLAFEDDQSFFLQCNLDIFVADPGESDIAQWTPTLLGRDFLNLCDVRLNHSAGIVSLAPLNVNASGFVLPP